MVKNGKMNPEKSGTLRKFKEYSKNNPSQSYELQREIFKLQLFVELPIDVEDYEENEEEIDKMNDDVFKLIMFVHVEDVENGKRREREKRENKG